MKNFYIVLFSCFFVGSEALTLEPETPQSEDPKKELAQRFFDLDKSMKELEKNKALVDYCYEEGHILLRGGKNSEWYRNFETNKVEIALAFTALFNAGVQETCESETCKEARAEWERSKQEAIINLTSK